MLYINHKNQLEYIKKDIVDLSNSYLHSNALISIKKNNNIFKKNKYLFHSILKYNIDINSTEIISLLDGKEEDMLDNYNFLKKEKYVNDIYFEDTIKGFHNINSIYILFVNTNNNNNKTKKILLLT